MVVSLSNIPEGSLVKRFITSGKPGNCIFCRKFVEKLEFHHTCYNPEAGLKLCHNCHHKTHFWINRLTDDELLKLLKTRFHHNTALRKLKESANNINELRNLIAPSRNRFMRKSLKLDINRISPKHNNLYKDKSPIKNKNASKKVSRYLSSSLLSNKKLR